MSADILLMLLAVLGLLLRLGLAISASGASRSKNAAGVLLRHVMDVSLVSLAFWAVGLAIFLQTINGALALDWHYLVGLRPVNTLAVLALVQALVAGGIVPGALSERSRFFAGAAFSLLIGLLIYPLCANWAMTGWLNHLGFVDVGGASFVHAIGGIIALVGAAIVGPRLGKYNRDGSCNAILGHNVPLLGVGVILQLLGIIPLTMAGAMCAGDKITALVPLNLLLAAAAAGLVATIWSRLHYGKIDVVFILMAFTGGMIAMTGAAAIAPTWGAVIVGAIAGFLIPIVSVAIELRLKVDDPAGVTAIHGLGGILGTLAVGFFNGGSFGQILRSLGIQSMGLFAMLIVAGCLALALGQVIHAAGMFRSKEADEYDGLDLAEHDMNAYPDFQQTMIKSYHLREA